MEVKYSIITVCRNEQEGINKTIKSVLSQKVNFENVEIIIVDGLSSDGTLEKANLLKEKAKENELNIRIYSEKDKGIYDAMNKGANLAEGEWCIYLNAGDCFFNKYSLRYLINNADDNYDIIYGDTVHRYKNRYKIIRAKNEKQLSYKYGMEFCHQSCMIRKKYLINSPYTLDYNIAGDYDFFAKAYVNGCRFLYIPYVISEFSKNGISSTNGGMVRKENALIKYKYNLIDKNEYKKEIKLASCQIKIRKILPSFIIKIRHDWIMNRATKNWKSINE